MSSLWFCYRMRAQVGRVHMGSSMTSNDIPQNSRPVLQARSAKVLQEQIVRLFGSGQILDLPDGEDGLDAEGNLRKLPNTEIWRCSYGVPITFKFANQSNFRLQYCLDGSATTFINKVRMPILVEQSCVAPADGSPVVSAYGRGYRQMTLKVNAKSLEEKLAALIGSPANRALEFDPVVNLGTPASKHLRRMTDLLAHSLDSFGPEFSFVAVAEFEQALLVAFLCANRHNYTHLLERRPSDSAPWQVRRVEEYIEANWDRPIYVKDVAAITGLSARSIFRTFQQRRGYSPLAFAKQVRLQHARDMLNLAEVTTTVTEVAFACGFSDLGHFSKDYRRAFGESPSQALNRAKGAGSANH